MIHIRSDLRPADFVAALQRLWTLSGQKSVIDESAPALSGTPCLP